MNSPRPWDKNRGPSRLASDSARNIFQISEINFASQRVYSIGMELRRAVASIEDVGPVRKPPVESVVLRHLDELYRLALHMTRDPDLAQDLTQECIFRALKNQRRITRNAKAWLFRTLRNALISEHRRRSTRPFEEEGGTFELGCEFLLNPLPDFIAARDVRTAIESLPQDLRAVIWLSDAEDFRLKEIAEILELPLGTVASRLFRARQELRQLLSAYGPVEEKNL